MRTDGRSKVILLSGLGLSPREAEYRFPGKEKPVRARLAPLALMEFLGDRRPDAVVAVCTPEAREEVLGILKEGISQKWPDVRVKDVGVPGLGEDAGDGSGPGGAFIRHVYDALEGFLGGSEPEDNELIVDLTHGPRHFAFLLYAIAGCVSAMRVARLAGVYYADIIFQPGSEGAAKAPRGSRPDAPAQEKGELKGQFHDIRSMFAFTDWYHAVRLFEESGTLKGLADLLQCVGEGAESGPRRGGVRQATRSLESFSYFFDAGLPLEAGKAAADILENRYKVIKRALAGPTAPLAKRLLDRVRERLNEIALTDTSRPQGWKTRTSLDEAELNRQAAVIDMLLDTGHDAAAFGLMREWVVTFVAFSLGRTSEWVGRDARESVEAKLHAWQDLCNQGKARAPEEIKAVVDFWLDLRDMRNALHHHGMSGNDLHGREHQEKAEAVRNRWHAEVRDWPRRLRIPRELVEQPRGRVVLVTPVGRSKGIVRSAFEAARVAASELDGHVEQCLLICSPETREAGEAELKDAGFSGPTRLAVFENPYDDVGAIEDLVNRHWALVFESGTALVNVTGGTTLMSLAAYKLATELRRKGANVRVFGLVAPSEGGGESLGKPYWLDESNAARGKK